jgi:hypothetical protein
MAKARSQNAHRIQQVPIVPPEQQNKAAPETPPPVLETPKLPLDPIDPTWDPNMYFGSHILPWPNTWAAGSSSDGDNAWEDWNKFVDDLGYLEQSGNPPMTDPWPMPYE